MFKLDFNFNFSIFRCEFQSIWNKIKQHLLQSFLISLYHKSNLIKPYKLRKYTYIF